MIQEIKRTNTQIRFNHDEFARWNIPLTIGEDLDSSIAREQGGVTREDADARDAMQPIIDPLSKRLLWQILEIIPIPYTYEKTEGKWENKWR